MRSFRLRAFLALTILVGAVAAVAYNLGLSAGAADVAIAAGASVIYAPASISPFAIIFGGFLLLLFIGFLTKAGAGPRHHAADDPWGPQGGTIELATEPGRGTRAWLRFPLVPPG